MLSNDSYGGWTCTTKLNVLYLNFYELSSRENLCECFFVLLLPSKNRFHRSRTAWKGYTNRFFKLSLSFIHNENAKYAKPLLIISSWWIMWLKHFHLQIYSWCQDSSMNKWQADTHYLLSQLKICWYNPRFWICMALRTLLRLTIKITNKTKQRINLMYTYKSNNFKLQDVLQLERHSIHVPEFILVQKVSMNKYPKMNSF